MLKRAQKIKAILFAALLLSAVLTVGCGKKDTTAEDTVDEVTEVVTEEGQVEGDSQIAIDEAADTENGSGTAASENVPSPYRNDYGITVAEIFGTGSSEESADSAASGNNTAAAAGDAAERAKAKGLPAPPAIDVSSWQYILASASHTLPEGYGPEDVEYVGDEECPIDYHIADNLRNFTDDCEDAGYPCYLSSGYRSYDTQKEIFDEKVEEYGYDDAAKIVLPPGTSEHQTGLCCDITDVYRSLKNPDELSQTETFQWLNAHCEEYGFILRYPENKEEITDVIYEPWHFRYVGEEAARYIKENDLCLEEFLALYGVE